MWTRKHKRGDTRNLLCVVRVCVGREMNNVNSNLHPYWLNAREIGFSPGVPDPFRWDSSDLQWRIHRIALIAWTQTFFTLGCLVINIGEGSGTPLQYSCLENPMDGGAWKATVHGVAKSRTRLSDFTFTFHFHALEKEMATHSSVLAWRIPGTEEPGGLPSMEPHRVGHDWSDLAAAAAAAINIWGCLYNLGFPGGSDSRESACNTGIGVQFLGQEVTLEEEMTTHSSIFA